MFKKGDKVQALVDSRDYSKGEVYTVEAYDTYNDMYVLVDSKHYILAVFASEAHVDFSHLDLDNNLYSKVEGGLWVVEGEVVTTITLPSAPVLPIGTVVRVTLTSTQGKPYEPGEIKAPHCLIDKPLSVKEQAYADKHETQVTEPEVKPYVPGLMVIRNI